MSCGVHEYRALYEIVVMGDCLLDEVVQKQDVNRKLLSPKSIF